MPNSFQRSLLPLDVVDIYDNDLGSADLKMIGTCCNGKDYAIKSCADGNGRVPATELFCYELAYQLHIATPEYQIVKLRDASLAFGSAWEGGVNTIDVVSDAIDILTGKKEVRGLSEFLSKVYALDLFVNNIDRHFGNYLFRESFQKAVIPLAFDFSRAWYAYDPIGYQSVDIQANTQIWHEVIVNHKKYNASIALSTLDAIAEIPVARISDIINAFPDNWLTEEDAADFTGWWSNGGLLERIRTLKASV